MSKETVQTLKSKLRVFGAKLSGNKNELLDRVHNWTEHKLDRTLFSVPVVPHNPVDCSIFSKVEYTSLEKLSSKFVQWLSKASIYVYFEERMGRKGNEKGRRLFMCDFLKNCQFHREDNDIYFRAKCCAEMRKTVEYDVNVHTDLRERTIVKSQCECPAGIGPSAACKHVSALLYAIEYYAVTGNVKQMPTCTSTLQQWHKPKTSKGRNIEKCSVDDMLKGTSTTAVGVPSVEVTNFFLNAFSKGKLDECEYREYITHCGFENDLNEFGIPHSVFLWIS